MDDLQEARLRLKEWESGLKEYEDELEKLSKRTKEINEYLNVSYPQKGIFSLRENIRQLKKHIQELEDSKPVGWLKYPKVLHDGVKYTAGDILLKAGMVVRVTTDKADGYSVVTLKKVEIPVLTFVGGRVSHYNVKLYFDHPDRRFKGRVFLDYSMGIIPHEG